MGTRHLQWCLFLGPYLAAATAIGQENKPSSQWSQFRGPGGQGAAADRAALPLAFGPTKNVLWKTPLQLGHSSPCIWNDRIFLTAADSGERQLTTICLDRQTGEERWQRSITVEKLEALHQLNCPASSTPASRSPIPSASRTTLSSFRPSAKR